MLTTLTIVQPRGHNRWCGAGKCNSEQRYTGTIDDNDGLGTFSYQWLRNNVAIGSATDGTYTLGDADVGKKISVEVSYTDGHGTLREPEPARKPDLLTLTIIRPARSR
ncbi:hypothetical protein [Nitrosomonas sp.]|uniref:hypothetical protein n=1 Tax=Nitrosomonas sp. TaxID=42353 RepID=UPI002630DD82|nr:hypothetical protein [Nitrosomonas sp.]